MKEKELCRRCYGIGYVPLGRFSYDLCKKCKGWGEIDWLMKIFKEESAIPYKILTVRELYKKFYKDQSIPPYLTEDERIAKAIRRRRQKFLKREKTKLWEWKKIKN